LDQGQKELKAQNSLVVIAFLVQNIPKRGLWQAQAIILQSDLEV
jgi:hypothetical protein